MAPDLKEELPVLYLRLRDAAQKRRSRIIEFAQKRSGLSRARVEDDRVPGGQHHATLCAALRADPDIAAQLAKGSVVIVAGRANLAEHPREVGNGVVAALQIAHRRQGAAGVAPRQRRRRDRDGPASRATAACTVLEIAKPRPPARSSASSCSAATRWPTSPTPTSPGG